MKLFIDGSVDPKLRIGYGAYLLIKDLENSTDDNSEEVRIRAFEDTSSTKLELEVLLWAVDEINGDGVTVYTDCQNIIKLLDRRAKLEKSGYRNKQGEIIKNQ